MATLVKLFGPEKEKLLKIGISNRIEKSERYYCDDIKCKDSQETIDTIIARIGHLINLEERCEDYFVALSQDGNTKEEIVTSHNSFQTKYGINYPIDTYEYFDHDDDLFRVIFLHSVSKQILIKLLRGKLGRSFDGFDYHMSEIFVLFNKNRCVLNLYDDRGFDVAYLPEQNNSK